MNQLISYMSEPENMRKFQELVWFKLKLKPGVEHEKNFAVKRRHRRTERTDKV
jgi:hypothetical protein